MSKEILATPHGPATTTSEPDTLTITSGDSTAHIVWTQPGFTGGSSIIYYNIYRDNIFIKTVDYSQLSYDDNYLINGNQYLYEVRAVNGVGESTVNITQWAYPHSVRATVPESLTVTQSSINLILNWSAPLSSGGADLLQ